MSSTLRTQHLTQARGSTDTSSMKRPRKVLLLCWRLALPRPLRVTDTPVSRLVFHWTVNVRGSAFPRDADLP